jgi:hypothetical protein
MILRFLHSSLICRRIFLNLDVLFPKQFQTLSEKAIKLWVMARYSGILGRSLRVQNLTSDKDFKKNLSHSTHNLLKTIMHGFETRTTPCPQESRPLWGGRQRDGCIFQML